MRGSTLAIVYGIDKLKQDLQLWVLERYGGDRFHPDMGSILQDMIGTTISPITEWKVANELYRILDNYQRTQFAALKKRPETFSNTELLMEVDDVSVQLAFDAVSATVKVRAASNDTNVLDIVQGL